MAIQQVSRLQNQVSESHKQVGQKEDKIRELQTTLVEIAAQKQAAEVELQRTIELHDTRMSALQKEHRTLELKFNALLDSKDVEFTPQRAVRVAQPIPTPSVEVVKSVVKTTATPRQFTIEKNTAKLRETNKQLRERVLQGRKAIAAVNTMRQARRERSPHPSSVIKTAPHSIPSDPPLMTPKEEIPKSSSVVIFAPDATPKQLDHTTPIRAREFVHDKENIREVENSATLSAKKTPGRLQRRLSLQGVFSPSSNNVSKTPKSSRKSASRGLRTPLKASVTAL